LIYDGVLYFNNSPVAIPSTETVVTKNVKKKSKKIGAKLFDINLLSKPIITGFVDFSCLIFF